MCSVSADARPGGLVACGGRGFLAGFERTGRLSDECEAARDAWWLGPTGGSGPIHHETGGGPTSARTAAGGASLPPASDSFGGIKCADALGGRVHERVRGMVAGDTTGSDRGFEEFVPLADDLYDEHLDELRKEGLIECVDAIRLANSPWPSRRSGGGFSCPCSRHYSHSFWLLHPLQRHGQQAASKLTTHLNEMLVDSKTLESTSEFFPTAQTAEAACQHDHRNNIRTSFAWAWQDAATSTNVAPSPQRPRIDAGLQAAWDLLATTEMGKLLMAAPATQTVKIRWDANQLVAGYAQSIHTIRINPIFQSERVEAIATTLAHELWHVGSLIRPPMSYDDCLEQETMAVAASAMAWNELRPGRPVSPIEWSSEFSWEALVQDHQLGLTDDDPLVRWPSLAWRVLYELDYVTDCQRAPTASNSK